MEKDSKKSKQTVSDFQKHFSNLLAKIQSEDRSNESLKGLVGYDEYDIVWPDAIKKK